MKRRLPPLNTLRVFEVAVRTSSYAEAAIELGVTHGAVSRQITTLEGWLGQQLFIKQGRRMAPTPMARVFASEVARSLDRIAVAAEACGRSHARQILRVSAPASFAMRWLIPRLTQYHAEHPDIEVVVTTVSTVLEDVRGGVDVAIRRGSSSSTSWPQHRVIPVLDDVDTLIMSPALFAQRPIRSISDVEGHIFLGSETRPGDWTDWLEAAGLQHLIARPRQVFDHFFVTRQAVEDGLGIGIGPLPMLDIDVVSGKILTPLADIRVPRLGYVAVIPNGIAADYPAAAFIDWLRRISSENAAK